MKRLSIVFTCDSEPIGLYEIERRLRTAGFTRPQAGSIMDAEQSDELAEAYEQGKQAVFDAMNHFDELAIGIAQRPRHTAAGGGDGRKAQTCEQRRTAGIPGIGQ